MAASAMQCVKAGNREKPISKKRKRKHKIKYIISGKAKSKEKKQLNQDQNHTYIVTYTTNTFHKKWASSVYRKGQLSDHSQLNLEFKLNNTLW